MKDGRQQGVFPLEGRTIGFGKKEFKSAQNFTVRLGENWAKDRDIILGDYVSIVNQEKDVFFFQAIITHIMTCNLCDVPKSIIKDNHQANMRDGIGLVLGLQEYYKKTLVPSARVVCVGFTPVKLEAKNTPVRKAGVSFAPTPPGISPEMVYSNE